MRIYFHILRAHIGPFFFSFFTLMFIFLLQFIMKFIDQLVGKGLSWLVIGELIIMNLAWMVVLAVPMSVLVSTLMAFGGLSANNEITAMKASGMSFYRMIAPVFLLSIILAYLMIEFNNKILPEANHRAKTLIIDIRRKKATLTINPGLFNQDIPGYSMLVRKTFERSNDLEGITIYDYTNPTANILITAHKGTISFSNDYRNLIMDLSNGEIHQLFSDEQENYRKIKFEKHRIIMPAEGFEFERSGPGTFGRSDRELSAQVMMHYVDSLEHLNKNSQRELLQQINQQFMSLTQPLGHYSQTPIGGTRPDLIWRAKNRVQNTINVIDNHLNIVEYNQKRINEYLVEIHKKYSIPVACIVFVFLGAPLGLIARRGTFGVAATLSVGFFLLYWASLIGGEKLADRGYIDPWFGMWMANIFLGALGIYITFHSARETPIIRWWIWQKYIPQTWRSPDSPNKDKQL